MGDVACEDFGVGWLVDPVLNAAYAATPERFVRRPSRPPALPKQAEKLLEQWLAWARRSRLPSCVEARAHDHRPAIRHPLRGPKRAVETTTVK
jgi:hypothetical protein